MTVLTMNESSIRYGVGYLHGSIKLLGIMYVGSYYSQVSVSIPIE